jgi:hypothetical protein
MYNEREPPIRWGEAPERPARFRSALGLIERVAGRADRRAEPRKASTYFRPQAFPNRQNGSGPRLGFFWGWHIRDQRLGASVGVDYLGVGNVVGVANTAWSFRSLAPPS